MDGGVLSVSVIICMQAIVFPLSSVALPDRLHTEPMHVDVEEAGTLTRGMSVFDRRTWMRPIPNVDVATDVDRQGIRDYMRFVLSGK